MSVLIVTLPDDFHAHAVRWAVEALGSKCDIVYPLDLIDRAEWTWAPGGGAIKLEDRSGSWTLNFGDYRAVWMRRVPAIFPLERLEDRLERSAAEAEVSVLSRSLFNALEDGRFAVNEVGRTRAASLKPFQLEIAAASGLHIPETLISNSRSRVLEFYDENRGNIVYKPLKAVIWHHVKGGVKSASIVPTSNIDRATLVNCDLAAAPGIFQRCVDKVSEIRVTIMGSSAFAWVKSFPDRTSVDVDWRFAHRGAIHKIYELPKSVLDSCVNLMTKLGLVFACIDFAVDAHGDHYFLELNPQGQWLWGDSLGLGINQLEAMAQFLIRADSNFRYDPSNTIDLSKFAGSDFQASMAAERELHAMTVQEFNYHNLSFNGDIKW